MAQDTQVDSLKETIFVVTFSNRLALVLVLVVMLAGCTSGGPGEVSSSSTTPTPTPTPTPTQTQGWVEDLENTDSPATVNLRNTLSQNVTVHIRISMSGETVHNDSYLLEPDSEQFVYDTSTDDPDGSEEFSAVVTVGNETTTMTIKTNECYTLDSIDIIENRDGEATAVKSEIAC